MTEKEYKPTEELEAKEGYVRDYITNQHAKIDNPDAILTDRIESLISQEHAKWIAEQEKVSTLRKIK